MLNYLSYLFDAGFEYRTIGCQMSAISAHHEYADSKPVGQHPHVCALLKVVFNQRSSQPRYVFIWGIQTILDFVKFQWSRCDLSDKVMTYKVVILMALSSASRASAIRHLEVRYTLRPQGKFVFTFHKLHKSWKYGKTPPSLEFPRIYKGQGPLCGNNFESVYKAYISAAFRKKALPSTVELYSSICRIV